MSLKKLQQEVTHFLSQVRKVLSKEGGKNFHRPGNREKNRKDLADLDITPAQVQEMIRYLTYENYYKGPVDNFNEENSTTYEFGTLIDEYEIYIKLELIEIDNQLYCKCISFHKAEFPIRYPLKGGEEK